MTQPSLRDVQQWMKARIRPDGVARRAPSAAALNPQRGVPGIERLGVYAEGYVVRTREALAEVYEAIAHILGPTAFTELALAYARQHPSHDYNLSFVGRHLPEFLTTAPLTAQLPFLPDLAKLEWAICQAFHAAVQPPVSAQRLAALSLEDWDRARLVFQPAVGRVASTWPILDLWQARTRPTHEVDIPLVDRPQRVLVFRQGLTVRCELLDTWEDAVVEGLLAGRTLGHVCGEIAERAGDAALPMGAWCSRWMERGLLSGCEVAPA